MSYRLSTIKQQIGIMPLLRMGAHEFTGSDALQYGKPHPVSSDDGQFVDMPVGLMFRVANGKKGYKVLVALEPDDTYTVRMVYCPPMPSTAQMVKHGAAAFKNPIVKLSESNVYEDNLGAVIESMFDKSYQKGF